LDRNFASSGKSWTIQKLTMPIRTVARPSRMKIQDQPGSPPTPFILAMAAARRPPKEPARAAALKKMADWLSHGQHFFNLLLVIV
jgi:hypothetical protein